jgi:hypothetical protein
MSQIFSPNRMFAVKHALLAATFAAACQVGCEPPAVDRTCNPLDPWSCGADAFCGQTPSGGRCVPWSCGDGEQRAPEECDFGDGVDAISCASYLGGTGSFSCGADCRWDFSGCSRCGNGLVNGLEDCDQDRFLPGLSCESLGYAGGVLGCLPSCRIDTRRCLR